MLAEHDHTRSQHHTNAANTLAVSGAEQLDADTPVELTR